MGWIRRISRRIKRTTWPGQSRRSSLGFRPCCEALEDRRTPTTLGWQPQFVGGVRSTDANLRTNYYDEATGIQVTSTTWDSTADSVDFNSVNNYPAGLTNDLTVKFWKVTSTWNSTLSLNGYRLRIGTSPGASSLTGSTIDLGSGGTLDFSAASGGSASTWTAGGITGTGTITVNSGSLTDGSATANLACSGNLKVNGGEVDFGDQYVLNFGTTGTMEVDSGKILVQQNPAPPLGANQVFTSGTNTNTIDVKGGTLELSNALFNITFPLKLYVQSGNVQVDTATTLVVHPGVTQSGGTVTIQCSAGAGDSEIDTGSGAYYLAGGTLQTSSDYGHNYAYIVGNLDLEEGTVKVGSSLASGNNGANYTTHSGPVLYVDGTVNLDGGTLQIYVWGDNTSMNDYVYSQLRSNGTVNIDHANTSLKVSTVGATMPSGDSFNIIDAATVSGTYGTGNITWDTRSYSTTYLSDDLQLTS